MKNRNFKKMMRVAVMILSIVSIPVMVVLLMVGGRTYGTYFGNTFEMNYWWQVTLLMAAVSCIICRIYRKSEHIDAIIKVSASVSVLVITSMLIVHSWWGVVKVCDALAGTGNGVFVFLMSPLWLGLVWIAYALLGGFVSNHNVKID